MHPNSKNDFKLPIRIQLIHFVYFHSIQNGLVYYHKNRNK